jgi:5-dehydro-2-deoxygluconokinase
MTSVGDKPLYVLRFDQRVTFQIQMFRSKGALSVEQTAQIAAVKQVIYDGFKAAIATGVPQSKAAVLVDEQFGSAILRDAAARGYLTACCAEKGDQEGFDFEYGKEFREHIEAFRPTFCKVLVRYNPEGDKTRKARQFARLRRLSDYLHDRSQSRLLLELVLVHVRDMERNGGLTVQAMEELQHASVEPDVWGIEGMERREDCVKIVAAARRGGRSRVGCIILGNGEDDARVRRWLSIASTVRGFMGFSVGHTSFWDPLVAWRQGNITREETVAVIARRYRRSVDSFEGRLSLAA